MEILQSSVEMPLVDTSTYRSSNQAPFVKISKSGDGGRSGGIFSTVEALLKSTDEKYYDLKITHHLMMKAKEIHTKITNSII